MNFQFLVIAALLSGFILLGLGVVGIRPNREIQWVPVDGRSRGGFVLLGVLLLLVGGWWYLVPPDTEIGTTQALSPADSAFTSGKSSTDSNAIETSDDATDAPPPKETAVASAPETVASAPTTAAESADDDDTPAPAPAAAAVAEPAPAPAPQVAAAEPPPAAESSPEPAAVTAGDELSPAARELEENRSAPRAKLPRDSAFVSKVEEEPAEKPSSAAPPVIKVSSADVDADATDTDVAASKKPVARSLRKRKIRTPRAAYLPVTIHVSDRLGSGQFGEHLHLQIEGRHVAELKLDEAQQATAVAIHLPAPGRLRYRLTGFTDWKGSGRQSVDVEGYFLAANGGRFEVQLLAPEGGRSRYLQ